MLKLYPAVKGDTIGIVSFKAQLVQEILGEGLGAVIFISESR